MTHLLIQSFSENNKNIEKVTKDNNLQYKKYGNIAIFKYNKTAKYGSELQRKSRGIVIDLENNKLLCTSFNGSLSLKQFKNNVLVNNCIIEENIEGTLLNLYFYDNRWKVSTKFCLNADETKFRSNKTFRQLFDSLLDINKLDLDKNFTYSFVLVHKDIRLVSPVSENKLYHIETTNNITGEKIYTDIGVTHPKILFTGNEYISNTMNIPYFNSYDIVIDNLNKLPWSSRGYMLYSVNRNSHCSLINPVYEKIKKLVAGQSDIRYICLDSLFYKKNNNELLKYFPEYKETFIQTIIDYNKLKEDIYKYYLEKKCFKKKNIEIPRKYNKAIFDIHGYYIKEKNNNKKFKIFIDTVDIILKNYDCAYIFTLLYK